MGTGRTERIIWIDSLKAFAIFLVILGHSIQCLATCAGLSEVYDFIYSFPMPLFMTLSGLFIGKMLADNPKSFLLKRARQLLLPVLSFSVVAFLVRLLTPLDMTMGLGFADYLAGGDMWFLKYLFGCSVIAYVSNKLFRREWLAATVPPALLVTVSRVGIFRLLPFLWLGHYVRKHEGSMARNAKWLLPACLVAFALRYMFWNLEYDMPHYRIMSIKKGVEFSFSSFAIVTYRFAVGMLGSMALILIFSTFAKNIRGGENSLTRFLLASGRRTLGIYCLQIYLLEHLSDNLEIPVLSDGWNILLVFSVAVLEFILCSLLVGLLERNRLTRLLLLGQ